MNVHDRYGLTKVINARGTFTPLGVSRSSDQVSRAVAEALQDYFVIDELQNLVSRKMAGIWAQPTPTCLSVTNTHHQFMSIHAK